MQILSAALLALVVATLITALELITSKYPQTFFVLKRSPWLYGYCLIYGLIGFGIVLAFDSLEQARAVQLQGFGLDNPWIRAIAVGVTIKAFLHVRLFSATVGGQTLPIGVETIVQLFEPWLLDQIRLKEWEGVQRYLESRARLYDNQQDAVQKVIADHLPPTIPTQDRKVFLADVASQATVTDMMAFYLNKVGKGNFDRVFPYTQ